MKKKNEYSKKGFHNVKHFRISEDNYDRMISIKKGTWNYTFTLLLEKYGVPGFRAKKGRKKVKSAVRDKSKVRQVRKLLHGTRVDETPET